MDPSPTAPRLEYPLSQAPADIQRLIARVSRRNPSTRALLIQAGIVPGMRVLDAGSGAGDVAMMVAELVGPTGAVVGIDLNADSLEVARSRAKAASLDNVSFQIGDAQDISAFDKAETFDAVVGRLVLMYTRDPAQTLRGLVTAVRSGGVVVFQEIDFTTIGWKMHPEGPLYRKANTWLCEGFRQMGAHPSMGYELHATFRAAGLPPPELRMDALIGAGPAWDLSEINAGVIASLLPRLVELGIATAEEIEIDTLAARLRDEAAALGATTSSPPLIGAWTVNP